MLTCTISVGALVSNARSYAGILYHESERLIAESGSYESSSHAHIELHSIRAFAASTNDEMARAAEKDAPPEYRGEGKESEKEMLRRVMSRGENGETLLVVGDT